ncbi:MAG: hypothetical protein AAF401_11850, partial [Pseudomonadota bacterium]
MLRFFLAAFLFLTPTAYAQTNAEIGEVAAVMEAADQKDWTRVASFRSSPMVRDLALWRILSAGEGSWRQYSDFAARNPDWPNLKRIRREGERTMPSGLSAAEIDGFLGSQGVQTGWGALRRAEALRLAGRGGEADQQLIDAWSTLSMSVE